MVDLTNEWKKFFSVSHKIQYYMWPKSDKHIFRIKYTVSYL